MTAKGLPKSRARRFTVFMEAQDCRVKRKKDGLMVMFPDGTSTMVHFTPSERRGASNAFARFRQSDVFHPDDPKANGELPKYISKANSSAESRKRAIEALKSMPGGPQVVIARDLEVASGMDTTTSSRALLSLGYTAAPHRKGKKPKNRKWIAPEDIWTALDIPEPNDELEPISEPAPEPGPEPIVEDSSAVRVDGDREFIDTCDSWVCDLNDLPDGVTVKQYIDSLRSAGLSAEIRVWRSSETAQGS